jgi:hypothetical protein
MIKGNLQVSLELVMRSDEVGGHHVPERHRTHKHSQQALQHGYTILNKNPRRQF